MALYVKVFTSFFSSRKTIRLRAILGNDALWVPIRLWSYAAENQPDGDFSGYSEQELALLIGYSGDATSMLEALQQAGFLDEGMKIHNWAERNGYHETFSQRGKNAAEARWSKHKEKKQKKENKRRERVEGSIATSIKGLTDSESEVCDYCISIGLTKSDGVACFAKWQGNGWMNGKSPIKDWKATIRSWKAQGFLPSQKNGRTPKIETPKPIPRPEVDPKKWEAFLVDQYPPHVGKVTPQSASEIVFKEFLEFSK